MPTVNGAGQSPARIAQKLILSLPVAVDLLVVYGNSSDGTGPIADELAAKHPQIQFCSEQKKNGLGRAYIASFKWALERTVTSSSLRWTVIFRTTRMKSRSSQGR